MNFTGDYFRSISRQDQQCAAAGQFILRPTDNFSFGLSGSGVFRLSVSGNKVFDNAGNYIFGGQSGQSIFAKMYKDTDGVLTYINDKLLSFNPLAASYYDYLFYTTNTPKEAALYVSGVEPDLSFNTLNSFSNSNPIMTGLLLNNTPSKLYRILSGIIDTNSRSNIYLSGWTNGDISTSGLLYFGLLDETFDATGVASVILYTNFGELRADVDISTAAVNSFDYFTLWPSGETFFAPNSSKIYTVENFYNTGSRNLYVALEYVSGGASYPELVTYTGMGTGYLMGSVTGTGLITGMISGYTDVFYLSGISEYTSVTGNFTGNFQTTGSGLFGGVLYTGLLTSGYSLNITSGDFGMWPGGVGTGSLSFNARILSGFGPYEEFDLDTGSMFGSLTKTVLTGLMTNNLNYYSRTTFPIENDDYVLIYLDSDYAGEIASGNFSGMSGADYVYTGLLDSIDTSKNVSGFWEIAAFPSFFTEEAMLNFGLKFPIYMDSGVTMTGTGTYNPHYFTGYYNHSILSGLSSGRIESTGQIAFTNIWNLGTGAETTSLIDFKFYNYYNSTGYLNTNYISQLPSSFIDSNIINVVYSGLDTSGVNIAKLIVSDGFTPIELLISGTGGIL
jgi:hypothetical protein